MRLLQLTNPARKATMVVCSLGVLGVAAGFALADGDQPMPTIASHPTSPTTSTSASFSFTDSDEDATFVCSLDRSSFSACKSGRHYTRLREGRHTFRVEYADSGVRSHPAAFAWTIDVRPPSVAIAFPRNGGSYNAASWNSGCGDRPGICGTARDRFGVKRVFVSIRGPNGRYWNGRAFVSSREIYKRGIVLPSCRRRRCARGRTARWRYSLAFPARGGAYTVHIRATDRLGKTTPRRSPAAARVTIHTNQPLTPVPFTLSGNAGGLLYPGAAAQPVAVTLSNPNAVSISITSVTATLRPASLPSGCGSANFEITQSNISDMQAVQVPPGGSVTLPSQGATTPFIQMVDTGTNQDACQGTTVTLDYAGSAH
jgi:hypothetical protein